MIAIDLSKRFRPRAEAGLLSRLHQEAWQARVDALRAQEAESHVGEIVAAHLEGRFPLRDMEILAKYGHAEKRTRITVYCHNPDAPDYPKWDVSVGVHLPREVLVSTNCVSLYCGGPRFSRDPLGGLKPAFRATLTEEKWIEHMARQRAVEAARLPETVEGYFDEMRLAIHQQRQEYRVVCEWPAQAKAETGDYPTWGEICERFPVTGDHIRRSLAP
jgi:hypothetical protein